MSVKAKGVCVIGVICADSEKPAVREFFQLFKTPWTFWEPGGSCDVLIITGDAAVPESCTARLVIAFGTTEMRDDTPPGSIARSRAHEGMLAVDDLRLPLYTGALTLALTGDATVLGRSADSEAALIVERSTGSSLIIRCGYDLFSEVEFLLTVGQPREHAGTPTLDLHIALIRRWIIKSGIPLLEIPPVPPGYQFLACLTHDVDFLGIRRHRWDRTLAGFLLRASLGSLHRFAHGRRSLRQLLENWGALLSLPLVYAGVLPDFWLPFDRYIDADGDFRSTFFVIPFRGRPGRGPDGRSDPRRSVQYAAEEAGPSLAKLRSLDFEIGVHGIDAWCDLAAATDEFREVAKVTGEAELGIRMHWLYFDESSFATLEQAGFAYDASIGYNDAAGFRAGTTQVFRPLSAERLLELPLHIQDTALFFPGRMNCTEQEALALCARILDSTQELGGVSTISWHERSLAPERQWDGAYRWLLAQLRQRGAYVGSAREVVSWFSARRAVDLQGIEIEADRLRALADRGPGTAASPALLLRIHNSPSDRDGPSEREGAAVSVDIPVDADSLSELLSTAQATARSLPAPEGRAGSRRTPSSNGVGALISTVAPADDRRLLRWQPTRETHGARQPGRTQNSLPLAGGTRCQLHSARSLCHAIRKSAG
jgi:hypothetical protein